VERGEGRGIGFRVWNNAAHESGYLVKVS